MELSAGCSPGSQEPPHLGSIPDALIVAGEVLVLSRSRAAVRVAVDVLVRAPSLRIQPHQWVTTRKKWNQNWNQSALGRWNQ